MKLWCCGACARELHPAVGGIYISQPQFSCGRNIKKLKRGLEESGAPLHVPVRNVHRRHEADVFRAGTEKDEAVLKRPVQNGAPDLWAFANNPAHETQAAIRDFLQLLLGQLEGRRGEITRLFHVRKNL